MLGRTWGIGCVGVPRIDGKKPQHLVLGLSLHSLLDSPRHLCPQGANLSFTGRFLSCFRHVGTLLNRTLPTIEQLLKQAVCNLMKSSLVLVIAEPDKHWMCSKVLETLNRGISGHIQEMSRTVLLSSLLQAEQ